MLDRSGAFTHNALVMWSSAHDGSASILVVVGGAMIDELDLFKENRYKSSSH